MERYDEFVHRNNTRINKHIHTKQNMSSFSSFHATTTDFKSAWTDSLVKSVLDSHAHVHGYADFQKRSYEHFMDELLPHIVEEHAHIVYESKTTHQKHVVTLGQLTMAKPNHREADGKVGRR